jgi:hypothetical protein
MVVCRLAFTRLLGRIVICCDGEEISFVANHMENVGRAYVLRTLYLRE